MRGEGQIAELVAVAEPDVGVIVNVGPVHLELLGTVDRVAAAKAELIRDLRAGAACVVPAERAAAGSAPARRPRHDHLRPRRRGDAAGLRRGEGGDRGAREADRAGAALRRALQPAEHPRGGGRGAGRGSGAGGPRGAPLLGDAGRDHRAARRRDRGQRLLQRQPDVHAGGPPAPRRDARGPPRGDARHDGGAGPGLRRVPPRHRRRGRRARDRRARDRWGGGHRVRRRLRGRDAMPRPPPRRPARCSRRSPSRATGCW